LLLFPKISTVSMFNSNIFLLFIVVSCFEGSSSVGTSVNPDFLAGFSTAAGKRSCKYSDSQESDPEVLTLSNSNLLL
jgi:hypothetical protein